MLVNVNPINVIVGKYITWLILLPTLIYGALQMPLLAHNRDINGIILHGMVVLPHTSNLFFKLTIWLYKDQMAQLINGILEINSSWGTDMFYQPI